jgi:hypothetical protein
MKQWAGAVLLSGMLCACTQPLRPPLRAPDPPAIVQTAECGGLRVQLALERKQRAMSSYEIAVTDASGHFPADITRVTLALTSLGKSVSTTTVIAQPTSPGHYVPAGGFFSQSGAWLVEVIIRRTNTPEVSCSFSLSL